MVLMSIWRLSILIWLVFDFVYGRGLDVLCCGDVFVVVCFIIMFFWCVDLMIGLWVCGSLDCMNVVLGFYYKCG